MSGVSIGDRWVQTNRLLLEEADQWGKYGETRSLMGAYLEELSNLSLPESAKQVNGGAAHRVGIIDVVLVLGSTVNLKSRIGLKEPRRMLHEGLCGLDQKLVQVPEPPRRARKSVNIDDATLQQSLGNIKPMHTTNLGIRRAQTTAQIPTTRKTFGNWDIPLFTSPPKLDVSRRFKENTQIENVAPPKEHPNTPKHIPRKTFKGFDESENPNHMTRLKMLREEPVIVPRRSSRGKPPTSKDGSAASTQDGHKKHSITTGRELLARATNLQHTATLDLRGEADKLEELNDSHVVGLVPAQIESEISSQPADVRIGLCASEHKSNITAGKR